MLNALEGVVSVILMIALGIVLAKRGWFEGGSSALVSRLVVSVALPAYMVSNLMGSYDRAKLLAMLPGLPVPFAVMAALWAMGAAIAALFRIRAGRRGAFSSMFALSNTIFIGLPVNLAIFGEGSLPYVLLYYISNTVFFWTLGVYGLARDGAIRSGGSKPKLISRAGLSRILSPPLIAFLLAVILILAGISIPRAALDFCRMLGAMTTPLSMLFIGIVIARVEWRRLRLERDLILVLAGRFLVSPLVLVLVVGRTDLPLLMKQVFLVQAAMPAMTQTSILAAAYGADAEYTGLATALTTALSVAAIPVLMVVSGRIF